MHTAMRLVCGVALAACSADAAPNPSGPPDPVKPPSSIAVTATDKQVNTLPRRPLATPNSKLDAQIKSYFDQVAHKRSYIMTDKPLYQPGESIWFRVDLREAKTMIGGTPMGATMQLESPRGSIVGTKRVLVQSGVGRNDFKLDDGIAGGEYTLRMLGDDGTRDMKKVVINTYEAPRLNKSIELLRKAYGEGDHVSAAVAIKRATGEPFATKQITAVVTLDDAELQRKMVVTDKDGKAMVDFDLPAKIDRGDGLLTIMADDAGNTESMQKRIPIVMSKIGFQLLPEGGDLVVGIPQRVYFMATNTLGKPADVEGRVVDDRGTEVTTFSSVHDGMGKFELEAKAGRTYTVAITKPARITQKFTVPTAKADGCTLRSVDQKSPAVLRFAAVCSTARTVDTVAMIRDRKIGSAAFDVPAGSPVLVELPLDGATDVQGAARVTLFEAANKQPLAERLVYHGSDRGLKLTVTADKKTYTPRDRVKLKIHATDQHGNPVKGSFGLAVVDSTILSFADDKSAKLLAHVYLEQELGGEPIEEPNYYFGTTPDAALAMDALLATRGYRRFEWRPVTGGQ